MLAGWLGQGTYDAALIIGAYCLYRALTSPVARSRHPSRRRRHGIGTRDRPVWGCARCRRAPAPVGLQRETHLGAGNYDQLASGYSYNPFGLRELVAALLDDDYRHRGFTIPAAGILLVLLAVALVPRATRSLSLPG